MLAEYYEEINNVVPYAKALEIYEECKADIPEMVKREGPDAQELFVKYEWMKRCWDSSVYAQYEYIDKTGNRRFQDLRHPNCKAMMALQGATKEEQEEAQAIRSKYFTRYAQKLGVTKRLLNQVLKPDYPIALIEYAMEALEIYGKYGTHEDVQVHIKEKRGYDVPLIKLKMFFNDHIDAIQSKRNSFVMQNKDFRIATESGRLETLNNMLTQYEIAMKKNPNNLRTGDLVLKVLEQARKECKGERLFLTVDGKIDVNAMVHGNENVLTSLQKLPVNLMVVGIVAAKAGINPMNLIAQLSGSYYKDYNGFGKQIKEGNDVDRPSELIRVMDWEDVGRRVGACPYNELGDLSSAIVIEEANVPTVEDKRSKLLELLNRDMESSRVDLAKEEKAIEDMKKVMNIKKQLLMTGKHDKVTQDIIKHDKKAKIAAQQKEAKKLKKELEKEKERQKKEKEAAKSKRKSSK